jgi:hypothetical protein
MHADLTGVHGGATVVQYLSCHTACVAASLHGDMLPLQLIFQGKTPQYLPPQTAASIAARVDVCFSKNHWSTQETMQRWIVKVLMPHAGRIIDTHQLDSDAHIVLLLDAWAVHKSAEFRGWLHANHPRIGFHLVYVPANCTSKLQLTDVALQRPFKSNSFNEWAAAAIAEQIRSGEVTGSTLQHADTRATCIAVVRRQLERPPRTATADSG